LIVQPTAKAYQFVSAIAENEGYEKISVM